MKEVVQACKSRGVSILMTGLELHPLEQECESLAQPNLSTLPAA
jgi:hypothetical protein